MIRTIDHGDVREFVLSTRFTAYFGYRVSVFLTAGHLIDTGFPRAGRHLDWILGSGSVERALLTHWHEDHAGNLARLAAHRIPSWISPETRRLVVEAPRLPPYRWLTWGGIPDVVLPPTGDPGGLEVVPTPGHTPDHVAFLDPLTETVFGGDLFLGVKACTVHDTENPHQTLASIRQIRDLRPKRYFDAHRGLLRDVRAAFDARADWLATAIGQVEAGLDRGDPDRVIRDRVLGREDPIARGSFGQMSKRNFVAAVRIHRGGR